MFMVGVVGGNWLLVLLLFATGRAGEGGDGGQRGMEGWDGGEAYFFLGLHANNHHNNS